MLDDNKNKNEKRLFIAIDIPELIKDNIYNFAGALLAEDRHIKVVHTQNIHITLKFLGNINISEIEKIKKALKETADTFENFKYEINGRINAFPNPCNARVVFLEIGSGGKEISEIYNRLEDNLNRIKIRKEKRDFSPHITIARIKNKKNIEKLINNHKMSPTGLLDCPGITLFESRLKPHGAEYIILGSYGLK